MDSKRIIFSLLALVFLLAVGFFSVRSDAFVSRFVLNAESLQKLPGAIAVSQEVIARSNHQAERYLVLYTPETDAEDTEKTCAGIRQLFEYAKKQYRVADPKKEPVRYDDWYAVIVIMHNLANLGDLDGLSRYVEQGGRVYFTSFLDDGDSFRRIYRKLGIIESGDYIMKDGIVLLDDVLMQTPGFRLDGPDIIQNFGMNVSLDDQSIVHATADNGQPLLWQRDYGRGRFVVFNGNCLSFKYTRGLLLAGVSYLSDTFVYPVFNMKLMYIDDFPAPFPNGYNKMIKSQYNCDIKAFYRDIWWPDMIRMEKNYGLKFTCVAIETYSNTVSGPFVDINKDMTTNLRTYGYEVISSGGELGIHGYNHQSLAPAGYVKQDLGYTPWANESDMMKSLDAMNSFMTSVFGSYRFQVYVPPSNILSPMGRDAVLKSLKDTRVLSSLYNDSITEDEFIQEFRVNEDGVIDVPRVTSGYEYTDINRWSALSALSSVGVFSHFVHPDDILDEYRSHNATWAAMYQSTTKFLDDTLGANRWLDAYTASSAASHIKAYTNTDVYLTNAKGLWTGYLTGDEAMSFIVRTGGQVRAVSSCTVGRVSGSAFIVKTQGHKFEFRVTGEGS